MLHHIEENRRLNILRRYSILDTPPEEVFDRVARMAARHFGTPIGTVTFVDEARQWFKAIHGLDVRETGRDVAFCNHTIMGDTPIIVSDSTKDARFVENPLVTGPPNIRFYAGAPLITTEGFRLGTVSAIDVVPREEFDRDDCQFLTDLAAMVVHELEMRLAASDFRQEVERRIQSEDRLRLTISHAPVVLATLDRDLRYTWITNVPPPLTAKDFIGRLDSDLWPPPIAEHIMSLKREAMNTNRPQRAELSVPIGDRLRHYDVTMEPVRKGDDVAGITCVAMDITDRKDAELALARSEARHRAVMDTAADAMVVIGEAGIIENFNPAAERIFGYTALEAIGQDLSILMPGSDRSVHLQFLQGYLTTGIPRIIGIGSEVTGQRKDGTLVPLDLSIAEWWDGDKRYFTGIMRDITRRKRSEAALRKAEAERTESLRLLNTMLESIPDPLFFKDRNGRYTVGNKATANALGTDNVVGKTDFEMLPPNQAQQLRTADQEVMATGRPKVLEEHVLSGRWFNTIKIPLRNENGDVIGVAGLGRDITERRAMIQQLRQAKEQAEAANRAKTSFLAAASHDLRQPVQSLVLFTAALRTRLKNHPAALVVARMKQSVDALQLLLESLLDISKLDAGVVNVNMHPVSMATVIRRLVDEYQDAAKRKGLSLRCVPCRCLSQTDPAHMERVLRNLIENAIRYTEKGRILIGCRRRGDYLNLQVIDTGIGIPEDQREAIFQEFHQLANPGRDRAKGLGLGLSIVRRLLELLGHDLTVKSVVGHGTCFSIAMPRVTGAAVCQPDDDKVASIGEGKTVLVIDDEATIRQGLEVLLQDWGYDVATAADAEEAAAGVAIHGVPDVIVADYRLQGGRTGTEAVETIHQACGYSIPAIIITGDTAPERIAEVKRSGHTIAHKPISGENLQRLISAALTTGH